MSADRLTLIPLDRIETSTTNAQVARRKRFNQGALDELAESVRTHGVLQPIIVRQQFATGEVRPNYCLIAGERRFLAARAAGLAEIPAVTLDISDEQVIEIQLIENLQRADLHPMEEAEGYQQLMKVHGHPIEELHNRVGKSRSYVYGRIKLLALCRKVRDAFYAGEISASTALLVARIPIEKLQEEALEGITGDRMSHRDASAWLQSEFMLRLKDAPFPTDDEKLNGTAGPCSTCPKRTGNQPELFGDVQSADMCTDPECFSAKRLAFANRQIAEARERGQRVITGAEAKKIAPRGASSDYSRLNGWHKLDEKNWEVGKTIKQIVGKDAERVLLQCPQTHTLVEVVSAATVKEALKASVKKSTSSSNPMKAAQDKARMEKKFRLELYSRLRPTLPAPSPQTTAQVMLGRLHHETLKVLCDVRGFEPPVKNYYGSKSKDYTAVGKGVDTWTDQAAHEFINDMIYVTELAVSTYSTAKPERLLEAAKVAGVDPVAVRREVTPKKKRAKKKAATKRKSKPAKKRSKAAA